MTDAELKQLRGLCQHADPGGPALSFRFVGPRIGNVDVPERLDSRLLRYGLVDHCTGSRFSKIVV